MFLHCIKCFCAHDMYANDVDVERRRSMTRVIISIPANDDDGSCGIVDGRLLLLPFIIFIEESLRL